MLLNKHLLILTPGFPSDEGDVTCIPQMQLFMFALKKSYPDLMISVIAFHYPIEQKRYSWNGIDVYSHGAKNAGRLKTIKTLIKVFRTYRGINKQLKVSIINSFWLGECTLSGYLLSRIYKVNFFADLLGQDSMKENRYLKLFKHLNFKILGCSSNNASILKKFSGLNCFKILPFGIDDNSLAEYNPNTERDIDIIGVGSLIPVKNYSLFIEIIYEVSKTFPEVKVKLIGDGIEMENLKVSSEKLRISGNIEFTGAIRDRNNLLSFFNNAKILLHTSTHEGQCYAFMEAYTFGLHIVSFDVGYIPETPKKHTCNSKEEMVAALKQLLSSKIDNTPGGIVSLNDTVKEFMQLC